MTQAADPLCPEAVRWLTKPSTAFLFLILEQNIEICDKINS